MARKHRIATPEAGDWYLDAGSREKFKVVDIDEQNADVDVQYFDGTIGELTREEWNERPLVRIEAPEDWTGPMETLEEGDLDYDEESFEMPRKHVPLSGFETDELLQLDEANPYQDIIGSDEDY
ncbi:MAG: hypothetical protein KGL13_06605 [Gammaproteobacteria bacterium]|nr:hypothetical protein [Gammaproteobacteria bacterium]MDE2346120.1 hypothetical protein [Gammaproteobacteria bacterium]